MKKNIVLLAVIAMLTGCASVPPAQAPRDQEPILVGLPIKEKIAIASKNINNQMGLLNSLNEKKHIGTYKLVEHNNNLDARVGSSRTVPKAKVVKEEPVAVSPQAATSAPQTPSSTGLESKVVKKIEWKNSSLNDLVKGFAQSIDYKLVLVSKEKDKNISFSVENESILNALERLKKQVSSFALITVDDKNKTIYLNYN